MDIMQFRAVTTLRAGSIKSPVSVIKQNSDFDLVLTVSDLRPAGHYTYGGKTKSLPRGVFAAYAFISLPPEVMISGIIPHSNFQEGLLVQSYGTLLKCGAFSRNFTGQPGEVSMFRFQCHVGEIYDPSIALTFDVQIDGIERPAYAPLVYGLPPDVVTALHFETSEIGAVKDEEVRIVGTTLKVTQ